MALLIINKLKQAIADNHLKLTLGTTTEFWQNLGYRNLVLSNGKKHVEIYVDDEYQDVKANNPIVLLNLILYEIEDYNDTPDYLVWCKQKGLAPEAEAVRNHYSNLQSNAEFFQALAKNTEAIPSLDWQLNSGEAQALRNAKY